MELEETLADLVDHNDSKLWGKYRGVVVNNEDPKKIGRLRLKLVNLFGSEFVTGWALPCLPYGGEVNQGMLFIPENGTQVWVEFEEGDIDYPVWVGCYWSAPEDASEIPKPNETDGSETDEVQSTITRKIIKTLKGHTIQLEDKDGEESIIIVQKVDDEKINTITMDATGICITDFTDNKIEMAEDAFTITSKVTFTIDASGQAFEVKADTVDFTKA